MFPVQDFPTHARYVMDLLYQRRTRPLWHSLFDNARTLAASNQWQMARLSLHEAKEIAENTMSRAENGFEQLCGAVDLLVGATYVAEKNPSYALQHYNYAQETFSSLTEDYGLAVVRFAMGLHYQSIAEWKTAFALYNQSLDLLQKPLTDDALRHMRVDLLARRHQVQGALFARFQADNQDVSFKKTPSANSQAAPPAPSNASQKEGLIALMPLFQNVSAGPGVWNKPYPELDSFVEINRILIHDDAYLIRPLTATGSRVFQLGRNASYGVVQVSGDSMDDSDILNEDYVIIEEISPIPTSAMNDAIVVLSVEQSMESQVFIKRIRVDKDHIELISENAEKKYPPQRFRIADASIIGKVVAILKRIPSEST